MMKTSILKSSTITRQEKEAFTYGDCWVLALEMHKQYDFPVAFFIGKETGQDNENVDVYWNHVVNVLPSGHYIDIHGMHTREELHDRWGEELESGTPDIICPEPHVVVAMLNGETRHYDEDATTTARKLYAEYNFDDYPTT